MKSIRLNLTILLIDVTNRQNQSRKRKGCFHVQTTAPKKVSRTFPGLEFE